MFKYTAALGVVFLCTGLLVFILLPRFIPFAIVHCPASVGGGFCAASYSLIYPTAFVIFMAGTLLVFWGRFDRAFVLGPWFVAGIFVVAFGLVGIVFGYLGYESCVSGQYSEYTLGCMAYNPEFFEPLILLGCFMISANAYFWYAAANAERRLRGRTRARFLGMVSVFFGVVLFLFGLTVVVSFVGVSVADEILWLFWAQIVAGLALMLGGILIRRQSWT